MPSVQPMRSTGTRRHSSSNSGGGGGGGGNSNSKSGGGGGGGGNSNSSSPTTRTRIAAARARCTELQGEICMIRAAKGAGGGLPCTQSAACGPALAAPIAARRMLAGHQNKILSCCWSRDSRRIASTSQDGHLIVWDGVMVAKRDLISLGTPFTLACAFDDTTEYVASGGLDNIVSIHRLRSPHYQPARGARGKFRLPVVELSGHDGYVSSVKYVDTTTLLSASGDTDCVLWDVERGCELQRFTREHSGDVLAVAVCPTDRNLFVSGSVDLTCKVWDLRSGRAAQTFDGAHTSDINDVAFLPSNGFVFGTASEDSSCGLFNLRSCAKIAHFSHSGLNSGVNSISFSRSGRLAFAGYEDHQCRVWDTLGGAATASSAASEGTDPEIVGGSLAVLKGHHGQVSAVSVAPDGSALLTASWDTTLRVWR